MSRSELTAGTVPRSSHRIPFQSNSDVRRAACLAHGLVGEDVEEAERMTRRLHRGRDLPAEAALRRVRRACRKNRVSRTNTERATHQAEDSVMVETTVTTHFSLRAKQTVMVAHSVQACVAQASVRQAAC